MYVAVQRVDFCLMGVLHLTYLHESHSAAARFYKEREGGTSVMITVRMFSRRFITQNQNVPQRALKTESKVECAVQNIESFLYVQL